MASSKDPKIIEVEYWKDRVDGPYEPREIVAGDWRDKDYLSQMDGLTMYSNDLDYQESHSKSAPDWSKGCEARDANNRVVLTFGGEPPYPYKEALLEGRLLFGSVIARDCQRHGI